MELWLIVGLKSGLNFGLGWGRVNLQGRGFGLDLYVHQNQEPYREPQCHAAQAVAVYQSLKSTLLKKKKMATIVYTNGEYIFLCECFVGNCFVSYTGTFRQYIFMNIRLRFVSIRFCKVYFS
jgi:hypothetical protein